LDGHSRVEYVPARLRDQESLEAELAQRRQTYAEAIGADVGGEAFVGPSRLDEGVGRHDPTGECSALIGQLCEEAPQRLPTLDVDPLLPRWAEPASGRLDDQRVCGERRRGRVFYLRDRSGPRIERAREHPERERYLRRIRRSLSLGLPLPRRSSMAS